MTENMGYRKYRTRRPWLRAGAPLVLVLVGLVAAVAVARAEDPLEGNAMGNGERVIGDDRNKRAHLWIQRVYPRQDRLGQLHR